MNDLIALVADKNMQLSLEGLLLRPGALGIRQIDFKVFVHPHRDPGCLLESHAFLRAYARSFRHGLVMLDREGSGQEHSLRQDLEQSIEERLRQNGWDYRAAAIVVDPELEAWIWGDWPCVESVLGWSGSHSIRQWLRDGGFLAGGSRKPSSPKEAFERLLRQLRRPRSSAIYRNLASRVESSNCLDPAFLKLRSNLQLWFPAVH